MDRHWIEAAQREGRKVAVVTGAIAAEMNPRECVPFVVPAVVRGPAEREGVWWVDMEVIPDNPLPQMYPEDEILGLWGMGETLKERLFPQQGLQSPTA